ncbi:MAG: HEAT repeat domain-containing protein [Anaerolineae bacterium]|nr:HEAT repeat domain-containing protein [Anaerolineae bacterium]
MTHQDQKIITSFQRRLEMDSALRSLGETTSEFALRRLAQEIVEKYGDDIVGPLISLLDTSNPQLRGGLGHVATLVDRSKIVPALRSTAYNRSLSDQARIAAITILERFLGVEPDPDMYVGMSAPEEIALHSLREALGEARSDPLVLVEYLEQLAQEPPDVLLTMVRAATRLEGADGVEMLRLFAQDPFQPAAEEAIQALGSRSEPEAVQALEVLALHLPPGLRRQAERSLQKLRLRGVPAPARRAPPADARCLATAPDAQGRQLLWFVLPNRQSDDYTLLSLLISDRRGVTQATADLHAAAKALPPPQAIGHLLAWSPAEQPIGPLLEAPFDYGRRQVAQAVERNWQAERPLPLVYRVVNPLLWTWSAPKPAELPEPASPPDPRLGRLLQHLSLFNRWFLLTPEIYTVAQEFMAAQEALDPRAVDQAMTALVQRLAGDAALQTTLSARLLALREWLAVAQDTAAADEAWLAAQTLVRAPLEQPVLAHLCLLGLRVAMINIARGLSWEQVAELLE